MNSIGLSSREASERILRYGYNEIIHQRHGVWISHLGKILLDPGGLMLLILGILYWILGNQQDAMILFIAYIPITAIDVALNIHSGKVLKELQGTLAFNAKGYRDGIICDIPIRNLVPDDVIILEEGIMIPADGILIEANHLSINEAALTGESIPVEKKEGDGFLAGTIPYRGTALGKILITGRKTELGRIGKLIETSKTTKSPLRKKVDHLVKIVFSIAMVLSLVLFLIEWYRTNTVLPSLFLALTLGMSAIPEEFPIVFTLYLSLGAWRLSRKKVLVKSLPSVETLGSVDVICTDKTGTLTEGQFTLQEFCRVNPDESWAWLTAIMACEIHTVDPMEIPIIEKAGSHRNLLNQWIMIEDHEFDPNSKTMSHVWKKKDGTEKRIAMKGAVEGVLEHCQLSQVEKNRYLLENQKYTEKGMRLLGVAGGSDNLQNLQFMGFLIFNDQIRPSAKKAVAACQEAGIEIKVITGDHRLTAHAVAEAIGLSHQSDQIHTRESILKMNPDERKKAYLNGLIFARFTPELKHELVEALKSSGKIVAMTGDGVNDAPALRLADIGISMGKSATDVTRSAAQMVLINNDFSGLVAAVFEGRRIFSNLQKSFAYLVSFHTPVILLAMIPPFLGWASILMPTHIILLELIVHPVSAFTFENLGAESSTRSRSRHQQILTRHQIINALFSGTIISGMALGVFRFYPSPSEEYSRALAYSVTIAGNAFFVTSACWGKWNRRYFITLLLILIFTFIACVEKKTASRLHLESLSWRDFLVMIILSVTGLFRLPTGRSS